MTRRLRAPRQKVTPKQALSARSVDRFEVRLKDAIREAQALAGCAFTQVRWARAMGKKLRRMLKTVQASERR